MPASSKLYIDSTFTVLTELFIVFRLMTTYRKCPNLLCSTIGPKHQSDGLWQDKAFRPAHYVPLCGLKGFHLLNPVSLCMCVCVFLPLVDLTNSLSVLMTCWVTSICVYLRLKYPHFRCGETALNISRYNSPAPLLFSFLQSLTTLCDRLFWECKFEQYLLLCFVLHTVFEVGLVISLNEKPSSIISVISNIDKWKYFFTL